MYKEELDSIPLAENTVDPKQTRKDTRREEVVLNGS
jgi:hypothetical protein